MGSLSNDNSDRNENSIKAIGLDHQKNNFAHALRFFVHFFVIIKRLRHKISYFHTPALWSGWPQQRIFFFFF